MALYTYVCTSCSYEMELHKLMSESQIINGCPRCGAEMKRQWRPPAEPVFKGTGFYETDYKAKEAKDEDTD